MRSSEWWVELTVRMTESTRKEHLTQCLPGVDQRDGVRTPQSPEATESSDNKLLYALGLLNLLFIMQEQLSLKSSPVYSHLLSYFIHVNEAFLII